MTIDPFSVRSGFPYCESRNLEKFVQFSRDCGKFRGKGQDRSNSLQQGIETDGFGDIVINPLGLRQGPKPILIRAAHHDDPDARGGTATEVFENGHAAPAGHDQVEENEIGAVSFGPHHPFFSVVGLEDLVTRLGENQGDTFAKTGIVINQQDSAI